MDLQNYGSRGDIVMNNVGDNWMFDCECVKISHGGMTELYFVLHGIIPDEN